jgi:hypothetical protein
MRIAYAVLPVRKVISALFLNRGTFCHMFTTA